MNCKAITKYARMFLKGLNAPKLNTTVYIRCYLYTLNLGAQLQIAHEVMYTFNYTCVYRECNYFVFMCMYAVGGGLLCTFTIELNNRKALYIF